MPITASHIKVAIRYTWLGQLCENVHHFRTEGAAFLTATMDGVLEAFWNDIKTDLRAIAPSSAANVFTSLLGSEIGGGLAYAEFAVPTGEQAGTRAVGGFDLPVTGILAAGFRQTVGTRVTRPGQKRLPFLLEADIAGNVLVAGSYVTPFTTYANHMSAVITLGAPVATGQLFPEVAGTIVAGVPTVFQDITGAIVNPNVTSQVSRKLGHGS